MFLNRHQEDDDIPKCSFCHKTQDQVDALIANPSQRSSRVCICNECIAVCNLVLEGHQKAKEATVVDRLRASVLEEHKKAQAADDTVVGRLLTFAAHR
jgi:ATP-dependent protease Clp ATPase subunit